MTMDGKSALLSMKSGFDVLVTLLQIVIVKCTVISKTECPSMYNLKSQFTPSFRKYQSPAGLLGPAQLNISAQKAAVCDCGRRGVGEVRVCIQQWDTAV